MVALFVIATILLFVVADAIVAYFKRRESTAAEAKPVLQPQGMPAGLFVDAHHAWISLTAEGKVRVGLDELARKLTGAIDSVRFAETGKRIARGETLMWVKAGNITVPVVSPVSGIVEATQLPDPNAKGSGRGVDEGGVPPPDRVAARPARGDRGRCSRRRRAGGRPAAGAGPRRARHHRPRFPDQGRVARAAEAGRGTRRKPGGRHPVRGG
jgi:biotin carboxyl carrier protein